MCGVTSAETPFLTAENFESYLASDDVLVYYFNEFLSLPSFSEALVYNQQSGLLEVVTEKADIVAKQIRATLKLYKSLLLSDDPETFSKMPPVPDICFPVICLNREEGIRWIKEKRLPFFLQSDCYHEYRLAKLLFQWKPTFWSHDLKNWSDEVDASISELLDHSSSEEDSSDSQESISPKPVECEQTQELHSSSDLSAGLSDNLTAEEQPEDFISKVVNQALKDAVDMLEGQKQAETSDSLSQPEPSRTGDQHEANKDKAKLERKKSTPLNGTKSKSDKPAKVKKSPVLRWQISSDDENRLSLYEFKEFLRGTSGEKLLYLWMDIQTLTVLQTEERKKRYLLLLRNCYLRSSSSCSLNGELLARWGLSNSPCWTEEKLFSVQKLLTEPLLSYWLPRYWMKTCCRQRGSRSEEYMPPFHHSAMTRMSAKCEKPFGSRVKPMMTSLFIEFRTGLFFTQYCEKSGNKLWINAVYFWTDLQHYHELFHQERMDLYSVQREAQVLYSTYISSFARRSINVKTKIRREVYNKLQPAFEELFDRVEEHVLDILLEPWTQLNQWDKESFLQVPVHEEERCFYGPEYKELLRVCKEIKQHQRRIIKEQQERIMNLPISIKAFPSLKSGRQFGPWAKVAPIYQGYRLVTILRQSQEIGHFMTFLQDNDASIHLICWLDLERYKTISKTNHRYRMEKTTVILKKYLNQNYFFGPDSPATKQQQEEILEKAGGVEKLHSESLSNGVAIAIQEIIRRYIEETWLPLFLSSKEFIERQKAKEKEKILLEDRTFQLNRIRARRSSHMSTSRDILLFRRTLLNPSTCKQFQDYVSVKGELLENDVRFWVEVQRYKDLCHSHSSLTIIQQKISTIISCFINSSMPPSVQINISHEQARRILEKRRELGPYIFREAQIAVFSELLKLWPKFQVLSMSLSNKELSPLLEEKRAKHRAKLRKLKRLEEEESERKAQLLQEKRESLLKDEKDEKESTNEQDQKDGSKTPSRSRHSSTFQRTFSFQQKESVQLDSQIFSLAQSSLMTHAEPLLWSYSKYIEDQQKEGEDALSSLENSLSTDSDSSSQSLSSKESSLVPSITSARDFIRMKRLVRTCPNPGPRRKISAI
ncbi:regulator of G-protein signaling 22 isoform X2 [Gambusia affinis]|uniref:regulator of G-protein signaling 22 isoform X2 n=1 Tax=Gambusia affinis TaxID=33528 RepID=UPI001CDBB764|nr:regulator of G-protein signaling 22 isoform X2 [Gambusia affinis]